MLVCFSPGCSDCAGIDTSYPQHRVYTGSFETRYRLYLTQGNNKTLQFAGFGLVAIDQRRGGDRFDGENRTLAGVGDTEYSYCDVVPDLEAALAFAREHGFSGKTAAWGSSYSAALIFKLGVDHPDEIDAIIAYSAASGEPMEGCMPEQYSADITQPVLALRPSREMEVPYVPGQMELFEEQGHRTYIADPGVHGSSMLNEDRVGESTDETWSVVLEFLATNLAGGD